MVRTEDACEIIKCALQNDIKVYLDGGWGVDALLGRQHLAENVVNSIGVSALCYQAVLQTDK